MEKLYGDKELVMYYFLIFDKRGSIMKNLCILVGITENLKFTILILQTKYIDIRVYYEINIHEGHLKYFKILVLLYRIRIYFNKIELNKFVFYALV